MRKRVYNSTYYHKTRPEQPRDVGHHQAPDQDENTLYQKLSEELKKKRKLNTSAIILELTFKKRRAVTEAITETVLQKFPFLDNRTIVSNTKTKKPVELPLLHYFVSCSLVNPSAEFIINQFKQTRL